MFHVPLERKCILHLDIKYWRDQLGPFGLIIHLRFAFLINFLFWWSVHGGVLKFHTLLVFDFPGGSDGKASAYNVGDPGSIPGLGRSPGEENGNPLQYSSLGNPTDGGSWQATVHGVTKSRTRLRDFTFFLSFLSTIKGPFWSADHLRIISHPTQLLARFPFMVFCYLLTSTEALSPKASSLSIEYEFSQFFSSGSFVPKSPLLCVLCVSTVILD